jgi:hypothetical protein
MIRVNCASVTGLAATVVGRGRCGHQRCTTLAHAGLAKDLTIEKDEIRSLVEILERLGSGGVRVQQTEPCRPGKPHADRRTAGSTLKPGQPAGARPSKTRGSKR